MQLQLQPSIATDKRSQALLALIQRLQDPTVGSTPDVKGPGKLDLSPLLVYRIPSLPDSAVIPMAWQWDCLNPLLIPVANILQTLSFASFDQIASVDLLTSFDPMQFLGAGPIANPTPALYAQYRALILLSTKLHSIMGTPAALQQAFAGLGYPGATILEGQNSWRGTQYPPSQGWAVFRVVIPLSSVPVGTNLGNLIKQGIAIANFWKPARCWLDSIVFQSTLSDTLAPLPTDFLSSAFQNTDTLSPLPSDFVTAPFASISDVKQIVSLHNAQYYKSGSVSYGTTQPLVAEGPFVANGNPEAHN